MNHSVFTGVGVALVTPFTETGVDYQKLDELIEFQIANKTDAIIICGTTGEPATMTAKVGAGKTSMSDMVVSDADLSVAAGNMDFAGKIRGNAKCVLTAGKMNMQLDGEVTDYNYRVSETAGGVLLDGDTVFTEDDKAAQIDHGATKSIELYCTMGEIKVDFTSSI